MKRISARQLVGGFVVALATGGGIVGCSDAEDVAARRSALEQQRMQLLNQFASAQNAVRNTQTEAMQSPSVVPLRDAFYELLRAELVRLDPRADGWLDRARELGAEIDAMSQPIMLEEGQEPPPTEGRDAIATEFAALERTIQPLQRQAMTNPEVAAAFAVMQDSVHAAMIRINPAAAGSIDLMRRVSARVDTLDAELRALGP